MLLHPYSSALISQVKLFIQLLQQVLTSKQQFASQMDTLMSGQQLPVSLAAFSRVAIVMTSGPQYAEAAVRELNGCCMQGHTLHVEHINRAIGRSQSRASASIGQPESSQEATKPQTSKPDSSSPERKVNMRSVMRASPCRETGGH